LIFKNKNLEPLIPIASHILYFSGVVVNQGAESNICFLMAYLAAKRLGLDPGIVKVI